MRDFLRRVLPAGGDYVVVAIRPGGKAFEIRGLPTLGAATATIRKLSTQPLNVYIAVGTYDNRRQAPKAKRALFLDLDPKDLGSKRNAAKELGLFCRATGLPMPAILVDSGSGLHAYWPFDSDLGVGAWRALAGQLKAKCIELGLKADHACTADAARILRVPTTLNHKTSPALPCNVIHDSGAVFAPADLLKCLLPANSTFDLLPAATGISRTAVPAINADL